MFLDICILTEQVEAFHFQCKQDSESHWKHKRKQSPNPVLFLDCPAKAHIALSVCGSPCSCVFRESHLSHRQTASKRHVLQVPWSSYPRIWNAKIHLDRSVIIWHVETLTTRCQTLVRGPDLAHSFIFGLWGHRKWLQDLARCYYIVHVPRMLQTPECSVQDVQSRILLWLNWLIVVFQIKKGHAKCIDFVLFLDLKFKCINYIVLSVACSISRLKQTVEQIVGVHIKSFTVFSGGRFFFFFMRYQHWTKFYNLVHSLCEFDTPDWTLECLIRNKN